MRSSLWAFAVLVAAGCSSSGASEGAPPLESGHPEGLPDDSEATKNASDSGGGTGNTGSEPPTGPGGSGGSGGSGGGGGWRGRGAGTMLPSGSLRSGYRLL